MTFLPHSSKNQQRSKITQSGKAPCHMAKNAVEQRDLFPFRVFGVFELFPLPPFPFPPFPPPCLLFLLILSSLPLSFIILHHIIHIINYPIIKHVPTTSTSTRVSTNSTPLSPPFATHRSLSTMNRHSTFDFRHPHQDRLSRLSPWLTSELPQPLHGDRLTTTDG